MPTPVKISARSSSITNSFVNSIIPVVQPSEIEVKAALNALGMNLHSCVCVFCGDKATEWDHLNALVKNKRPTGYISEIHNLVPACGKCNQSKGNTDWEAWMRGNAKLSPTTRRIFDLEDRIIKIKAYERIQKPTVINFKEIIGEVEWENYWHNCQLIHDSLQKIQPIAKNIQQKVANQHFGSEHKPQQPRPKDKQIDLKAANKKYSQHENVEDLEQYKSFITSRNVGANDKVSSSVNSYASYLNSIANQLGMKISSKTLGNQAQLEAIKSQLILLEIKRSTLGNLITAAKHYLEMVLSRST